MRPKHEIDKDLVEQAAAEAERIRHALNDAGLNEALRQSNNIGKGDRRRRRKLKPKGKKKYGW